MPGKVILEVTTGPLKGQLHSFDEHDTFIFGRDEDCHAPLSSKDIGASRHHFILEVNAPDARIRDLGSLNGTYVNRQRIDVAALSGGDEVQVGKFRLLYLAGARTGGEDPAVSR